jgi:hypothetical protein
MNLNFKQVLAILAAILGVLMVSTAQLTDLFGAGVAKTIGSGSGLLTLMINSVLAVVTGQAAMVKDVLAMPGVESVKVNAQANQTLAQIAVDPTQQKIEATPQAAAQVAATAKE